MQKSDANMRGFPAPETGDHLTAFAAVTTEFVQVVMFRERNGERFECMSGAFLTTPGMWFIDALTAAGIMVHVTNIEPPQRIRERLIEMVMAHQGAEGHLPGKIQRTEEGQQLMAWAEDLGGEDVAHFEE